MEKGYYTYILRCRDGSLYTGWTTDISKRLHAHNAGTGAKYTRSRRPVELVYLETLPSKEAALRREAAIKRLPRSGKLRLVQQANSGKEQPSANERRMIAVCNLFHTP